MKLSKQQSTIFDAYNKSNKQIELIDIVIFTLATITILSFSAFLIYGFNQITL
jgi:hypothetical protein